MELLILCFALVVSTCSENQFLSVTSVVMRLHCTSYFLTATSSFVIWGSEMIMQSHFNTSATSPSECECLVTALACSITTWFQRHSPFLLTRLKCSSSLVSDFYWIARLLLPITQSCATVRRHCCFLLCVVTNQTNNQKFSSYAVKTQTLKIPLLLRFCCTENAVGGWRGCKH